MTFKRKKLIVGLGLISAALAASNVSAALDFSLPDKLSENESASKTKLLRLGNGWLVSPYADAAGPEVYDTKKDAVRAARDVFVRACNTNTSATQCADASEWTDPLNVSNTAGVSSIDTNWSGDPEAPPTAFYGDSDKPNIFAAGAFVAITWVDKYCPSGNQRMVGYVERDGIEVPFSCLYVSYTNNVGSEVWTTQRLTDGIRDAKSDSNKGLSIGTPAVGAWTISWQEDPHGLQLGGAEGPGDGASGANVTHGTDVWYTYTTDLIGGVWAPNTRVSDNYTNDGSGGNASPVYDPANPGVEIEDLERGTMGSSRPNLMLVGGSPIPTAVIAYEETKGADRTDSGKFVRYHEFPYDSPPASVGEYENGEPGCIISDPLENSRRVRFVAQPNPSTNGLRMGVFWRQGFPTEGGPADIMVRVGKGAAGGDSGLMPEHMSPAVDADLCRTSDYAVAKTLAHAPALNISSNTIPWSPVSCEAPIPVDPMNQLTDSSSLNPYEDSRAHRGAIVGDDLHVGYSYAKDWAVATYTDMDNYNFWVRKYNVVSNSWTVAQNVSNIVDPSVNVKEPRLVKTPGNGPGCTDPDSITNAENCQDKSTYIVAWGTESNVYSHFETSEEFDIYYTRTRDKGASYEDPVVVPGIGINNRFESQLRPTPAGNILYSVWNEADNTMGGTHAMLSVSEEDGEEPPPPVETSDLGIVSVTPPRRIEAGVTRRIFFTVENDAAAEAAGAGLMVIDGTDGTHGEVAVPELEPGGFADLKLTWTAPDTAQTVTWTFSLIVDDEEVDSATGTSEVVVK